MATEGLYSIGEAAAILGVSPHTIRAWERRHHVMRPERTRARQRRYRAEDIELLRDVKRAVNVNGLSLRLAVQTVNGSQVVESPTGEKGDRRPRQLGPSSGNENVWQGVADVLPQLILVIDSGGTIVESNIAAAKTFDVVRQKLLHRSFVELVEPYDRAKAVLLFRPRARAVKDWELNLATPTGGRLYSFQSWFVRGADAYLLALIGTEMFPRANSVSNDRDQGSDPS